jgi:hypothetical protein
MQTTKTAGNAILRTSIAVLLLGAFAALAQSAVPESYRKLWHSPAKVTFR